MCMGYLLHVGRMVAGFLRSVRQVWWSQWECPDLWVALSLFVSMALPYFGCGMVCFCFAIIFIAWSAINTFYIIEKIRLNPVVACRLSKEWLTEVIHTPEKIEEKVLQLKSSCSSLYNPIIILRCRYLLHPSMQHELAGHRPNRRHSYERYKERFLGLLLIRDGSQQCGYWATAYSAAVAQPGRRFPCCHSAILHTV